jgi:hypothetical protein
MLCGRILGAQVLHHAIRLANALLDYRPLDHHVALAHPHGRHVLPPVALDEPLRLRRTRAHVA